MSELILLSPVKEEKTDGPFIELNPTCLTQMGWDENTILEWEQVNGMVIIRETDVGNCN